MADDRIVTVKIKSEYDGKGDKEAQKGLKKVEEQAKSTGAATQSAGEAGNTGFSSMAAGIGKAVAAFAAFRGVFSFLTSSIKAAQENARAVNMLSAAYQNVGYTAQGAMKQAQEFATKMQNLTGIADEAFLNAQRLLANYGVVGAKAQEAIQAAYALSVSQGMSFESSLMQIAKAAAGSTSSLSRYGIVLGDGVKEGEKFDAVLKQINDRFGASAQAAMGDTTAQVNALKESWGDFKEEIGKELIPAFQELIKWGNQAVSVLRNMGDFLARASGHNTADAYTQTLEQIQKINQEIASWQRMSAGAPGLAEKEIAALEKQKSVLEARLKVFDQLRYSELQEAKEQEREREKQAKQIEQNRQAQARKKEEADAEKKAQKEVTKELERQQQILDNMGLSSSKDLKGWSRDKEASAEGPTALEEFSGGGSQLASAENAWASVESEREAINWLFLEKQNLIAEEITNEELKQEALANLERQYNQQKLINDKNFSKARQQVYASMWGALAGLATSENKKVAAVGKVASIAQATMSTFTGAAKALELPFPANLAAMATVLAQGFALVSQIQSVKLAEGGLVKAVTGGVPAVIGEGGSDEAVLPLDNSRAMQRIGSAIAEENSGAGGVVLTQNITIQAGESLIPDITNALRNATVDALEMANLTVKVGAGQQGYSV